METALTYFYEAANLGSMRLASERIGVAVSSISRQIAQLERELGIALIERGRRSIQLTEAGRVTIEYYREQLADREALVNRLRDLRELKTGTVDLAVGEGFLGRSFSNLLDKFYCRNPGIVVRVHSGTTSEVVRMVLHDEAHIGMIFGASNEPKIRSRTSAEQPLAVLCGRDHPAASMPSMTIADLTRYALCLPPSEFRIRQMLNGAERRAQTYLAPVIVTSSLQLMRDLVRGGHMITVLPRMAAVAELEEGTIVSRPLLEPELEHATVSLIHRLGRQLDGAPSRLLGQIEAMLRSWTNPAQ
ncbi:transcriptional regulator, LysR family [Sphingomonas gellani]|uniref:Transcriptional regulator, LysR family n=1 Tax=Sphingomonas gellani TaxID=1166340 RepID=A0A1H8GXU2_9SPHN|nr:LysR family transcriptional regulator [Sphingomonas gellani]SEN48068.1 transcriptional regulator, LysR family [Sphingomonas gellani]